MEDKERIEAQISTLENTAEIIEEVVQNTREDLAEQNQQIKDVVERIELLQKEMNNFREEWEEYKQLMDQQGYGDMSLDEKLKKMQQNQNMLRDAVTDTLKTQAKILEKDSLTEEEIEQLKNRNEAIFHKLNTTQ